MNTDKEQSNFRSLIDKTIAEFSEMKIPDRKTEPEMIPFYIFAKFYKKFGNNQELKTVPFMYKNYIMFPIHSGSDTEIPTAWLCISRLEENSSKIEYFIGAKQPYNGDEGNIFPAVDVTVGFYSNSQGEKIPQIRSSFTCKEGFKEREIEEVIQLLNLLIGK